MLMSCKTLSLSPLKLGISSARYFTHYIGFIGLGNMGGKMVENLSAKNEKLMVYDILPMLRNGYKSRRNIVVVSSIAEMASRCDRIITMLPANDHVYSVYNNGNDSVFQNCIGGSIFIDCSTINPTVVTKLSEMAGKKGCVFMDAPVSGGIGGATAGTLTFMVGGCDKTAASIQELLMKMGSQVIYCGANGYGQMAKICNNMLLGISMVAVAEAMNLGMKFGLDKSLLAKIINTSSGRCWSSEVYNPVPGVMDSVPSSKNYEGGFKLNLIVKDMKLAKELAEKLDLPVELTQKALAMYENASDNGFENYDFSVIFKYLSQLK